MYPTLVPHPDINCDCSIMGATYPTLVPHPGAITHGPHSVHGVVMQSTEAMHPDQYHPGASLPAGPASRHRDDT